jgi:autotransporter-associated beta strand protein
MKIETLPETSAHAPSTVRGRLARASRHWVAAVATGVAMWLGAATIAPAAPSAAAPGEEPRDYPMGPISGTFRITDNASYARITKLNAGGYGLASGLKEGDYILGAFGKPFPAHGYLPNGVKRGVHIGVVSELGYAIDRAEGADGKLPLTILRPGAGRLDLTVQLPAVGAFGATFPIASPKFEDTYQKSIDFIHQQVMTSDPDWYFRGWYLLALLGHPDWDKTTGARPYRLSINKIRDSIVADMNARGYAPTESVLFDGRANPNHTGGGSNWALGIQLSGLASYYGRTQNLDDAATRTKVRTALQRGIEVSANSIQWWKQPSLTGQGGYSPESEEIAGMVSHGGVEGDYIHLGWGGGINACGTTVFMGFSFGRRVGLDMQARPMDGHYFGLSKPAFQAALSTPGSGLYQVRVVPPGKELYDYSVDEKFKMQWNLLAYRNAGYSSPGDLHDGHVCYQFEGWNPAEAVGKTAATIVGMEMYAAEGGVLTAEDRSRLERMKLFISRNYFAQMDSHAYCVGAQASHTLGLAFTSARQQRFALDNWRFYYALARDHTGMPRYMPARQVNDNYLDYNSCIAVNFALPGSILKGGLTGFLPGLNRESLVVRFDNPDMRWPDIEARYLEANTLKVPMPIAVLDGNGTALSPGSFTTSWKLVSGPGTMTPATGELTFSNDGRYRVELTATSNSKTVVEPIDIIVRSLPVPAGYVGGKARYERYHGIQGNNVSDLKAAAKFPDQPDQVADVNRAAGYYDSGSDFGSRLSGLFIPPVTGSYRFHVAADESATLRINPNGLVAGQGMIAASLSGPSGRGNFTAKSTQTSQVYQLTAGVPISFEALHKEGDWADDYLEVGWSLNGGPVMVIDGAQLAAPEPGAGEPLRILTQPQSVSANLGGTVTLSFTTNNPANVLYQWRRNGVPVGTAGTKPTLELANLSGPQEGWYDCLCTTPEFTLTTQAARVIVTDSGTLLSGALWREVYLNIGGGKVADLTANSKFPGQPDSSGPISTTYSGSDGADNYGQRWTGWITPPQTGNYRFFRTSDDDAEIWLGTTDQPASAVKILAGVGHTGGERQWSSAAPSAYIPLVGGQKYYIEVRHKEGGGGDYCAVTWQREGQPQPSDGSGEIASQYLSYRKGGFVPDIPSTNVDPVFGRDTYVFDPGIAGTAYTGKTLAGLATDANTRDTLTYSKVSGPSWLGVASDGTLSGTPQSANLGLNSFTVRVSDPSGRTDDAVVTITVNGVNRAPNFPVDPISKPAVMAGMALTGVSLAANATDPDAGDALVFTKVSGPAWLRVEPNGALTGTPLTSDVGTGSFVVRVTDRGGLTDTATLTIVVNPGLFYFDLNGTTAGSGVAAGAVWGTWGGWTDSAAGTSFTFPWLEGASAVLSAGTDVIGDHAITVDGTRRVGAMTFRSGFPTLSSGNIVLDATITPVTVTSAKATIDSSISGTGTLEKRGPGTLVITGENSYTGGTVIQEGTVVFQRDTPWWESGNSKPPGPGPITVNAGGTLRNGMHNSVTGYVQTQRTLIVNKGIIDLSAGEEFLHKLEMTGGRLLSKAQLRVADSSGSGSVLTRAADESARIEANLESRSNGLSFDVADGAAVTDLLCSGVISGDRGLSKGGAGTFELSGTNSYGGTTYVNAGTLLVTGGLGNSQVEVANGGTLAGTGEVNRDATINGTLAPGNNGIGVITFRNSLNLRGNVVFQTSKDGETLDGDLVDGARSVSLGGTLTVVHSGDALYYGDVFTLFNVQPTGGFGSVNLPALPEYLKWETTDNYRTIRVTNSRPRTAQTIAPFAAIPPKQYVPGSTLTVSFTTPTASSGLPVKVTVKSGPAVLSGNTLTISSGGTVVLAANQKGDAIYDAAPEVTVSIIVNAYGQTIQFGDLAPYQSGNPVRQLTATATSGLPVVFTSSNPAVARVVGNTLTILSRGTATITASQPGDVYYAAAPDVSRALVVDQNATIAVEDMLAAVSVFPETVNVLANDISGNGALTVQSVTQPAHGTVTRNATSVTYAGAAGYTGSDSFTYTIADAAGATSTATVYVSVYPPVYWTNKSGGSWPTASNWFQNVVPAGTDALANFRQLDIATNPVVTLDGARTVGGLVFADVDPSHDWTLAPGGGGSLTLDVSSGRSVVNVANRSATISAPLNGNDGLQKDGPGELILTGSNNITGGTVVNHGKLTVSSNLRDLLTINPGGVFESRPGFNGDLSAIQVVGGTFIGNGNFGNWPINLQLTGGTVTGGSRFDLGPGNGRFSTITSLPSASRSVIAPTHPEGILVRSDCGQSEVVFTTGLGTTPDGIDLEVACNIIQLWYFPAHGLIKQGPGTLSITSANAYWTGPTMVNDGTLLVSNYLPGDSAVTVGPKGTLAGTGHVDGMVVVNGTLSPGHRGIGTLEVRKALTLAGRANFEIHKNGATATSDRIAGAPGIAAGGSLNVTATGDPIVEGDVFTLFNVQPTGSFASVNLPPLPSYLSWQTTDNYKTIRVNGDPNRATQTIGAFASLSPQSFTPGAPNTLVVATPTASSGLAVKLSVKSGPATLSGNTITFTAAGTVVLAANQPGSAGYLAAPEVTTSIAVSKAPQTLVFPALAAMKTGSVTLKATASSGLPVTYTSSNPAVATVSGSTLTVVAPGVTRITATQAGDSVYALVSADQVLTVNAANTIATADSVTALSSEAFVVDVLNNDLCASGSLSITAITQPAKGVVTVANGLIRYLPNTGYTGADSFTYTVTDGAGAKSTATVSVTLHMVREERWNGQAVYSDQKWGDSVPSYSGYLATFTTPEGVSDDYSRRLYGRIVAPVTGSYTFWIASDDNSRLYLSTDATPANKTLIATRDGWANFEAWEDSNGKSNAVNLQAGQAYYMEVQHAEGGGGDHVSVGWQPPGQTRQRIAAFTPVVGDLAVTSPSFNVTTAPVEFKVTGASAQLVTLELLNNLNAGVAAETFNGSAWIGYPAGTSVALDGSGQLRVRTAANAGTVPFYQLTARGMDGRSAVGRASSTVNPELAPQTIAPFAAIANQTYAPSKTLTFTKPAAVSGLPVTVTVKSGPATLSGTTLTLTGVGTVVLAANQSGNADYLPAPEVTTSFAVNPASQVITFALQETALSDAGTIALTASASSGLAVAYTSSNPAVATVSGGTLTITGIGVARITATQAGNANYLAASPVERLITVNSAKTLAVNDTATAFAASPTAIAVLANDISAKGALALQSVSACANGTASVKGTEVVYTPNGSFAGAETFTYTVADAAGGTATATVTVSVSNPYDGLAAWWRMDEGAGTSAADSSGSNRTATFSGSPTWVTGRFGGALSFNGTSSHLSAAGSPTPENLTVSAWINPASAGSGSRTIFGQQGAFRLAVNSGGLRVTIPDQADYDGAPGLVTTNTWQHVAATYNRATRELKFYHNGLLRTTLTAGTTTLNSNPWVVGQMIGWGEFFHGVLDEVRLHSRVLSADEIARLAGSEPIPDAPLRVNNPVPLGSDTHVVFTVSGAAGQAVNLGLTDEAGTQRPIETAASAVDSAWTIHVAGTAVKLDATGQLRVRTVNGGLPYTLRASDFSGGFATGLSTGSQLKVPQTIAAFASIADRPYEPGASFTIAPPVASSGLPVALSVKWGPATVSGNTVTLTGIGHVMLAANQSGNVATAAAPEVTAGFTVGKRLQSIAFQAPALYASGPLELPLAASATSGLPVSFSSSNPAVAKIVGSTLVVVAPGSTVITASQGGNDEFAAASPVAGTFVVASLAALASNDEIATSAGVPATLDVTANDRAGTGALKVSGASNGANGTVAFQGRLVNYQPNAGFTGTDSFTYTVTDDGGSSATGQVLVTVGAAPVPVGTLLDEAGFENRDTGSWQVIKSSAATTVGPTINTSTPIAGTCSLSMAATDTNNIKKALATSAGDNLVFDFLFRIDSPGASFGSLNFRLNPPGTKDMIEVRTNRSNVVQVNSDAAGGWQAVGAGTGLTTGKSYRLRLLLKNQGTATAAFDIAVLDGATTVVSGSNLTAWTVNNITANTVGSMEFRRFATDRGTYTIDNVSVWRGAIDPNSNLAITTQPVSQTVNQGSPVTFSVAKTSAAGVAISYQWRKNGIDIAGATAASLTIASAQAADAGFYSVLVSDGFRSVSSSAAALTVTPPAGGTAQSIAAFTTIPAQTYAPRAVVALTRPTATSGLPVSLSVKSGPALFAGDALVIQGAGTVVVAANQTGNSTYAKAAEVTTSFTVAKGSQTIAFANLAPAKAGGVAVAPEVFASSGLPVSLASSNPAVATVADGTIRPVGAGTAVITATQAGDSNWNAAPAVTREWVVEKGANSIAPFAAIEPKAYPGTTSFQVSAPVASSGLPVVVSVKSGPATLSGGTVLLSGPGTVVLAANQAGNADFAAAAEVITSVEVSAGLGRILYVAPSGSTIARDATDRGLTQETPFATAAYAASRAMPGDTIALLPGVYTNPTYGRVDIWKEEETIRIDGLNGTAAKPITIRALTPGSVLLKGDGTRIFQLRNSSHVVVRDLVIEGEVRNIPLAEAKQYQFAYKDAAGVVRYRVDPSLTDAQIAAITNLPKLSFAQRPSRYTTDGLLIQSCSNVEVAACTISYMPGTGLRFQSSDLFKALGNTVHNCSRRSAVGNHGFTIHSATSTADGNTGHRIVVSGNRIYDNYNEIYSWSELKSFINPVIDEGKGFTIQKSTVTDANWMIGRMLVSNNMAWGNGFSGFHVNQADRVDLFNNTAYNNNRTGHGVNTGISAEGNDIRIVNNVAVSVNGFGGNAISATTDTTNLVINNNLVTGSMNSKADAADANTLTVAAASLASVFEDPATADFRLKAGSPAVGKALVANAPLVDILGATRDAAPDLGAYEFVPFSDPPVLAGQPGDLIVNIGQEARFEVTATGGKPLAYKWLRNGTQLTGADGPVLTLASAQVADAGSYEVEVSNSYGSIKSRAAALVVRQPVVITSQPAAQTKQVGGSATFAVGVSGAAPFTYEWRKDGVAIGVSTPTLNLSGLALSATGAYSVVVSNAFGTAVSSGASLVVTDPPVVLSHPTSQTVTVGKPITMSVQAGGSGPFSYRWFKDGRDLGATSARLMFSMVAATDAGSYRVEVTNQFGTVTSNNAVLAVSGGVAADFASWAASNGLVGAAAAPEATPMGDEIPNLLKYAFNLEPDEVVAGPARTLVPGSGKSGLPFVTIAGNGPSAKVRIEFVRRKGTELAYQAQFSGDLNEWRNATAVPLVSSIDATWERVILEDEATAGSTGRRFGRVVVTRQP